MSNVIWFEIPAEDLERAAKFYEGVFDWKIDKWNGPFDYWLLTNENEDDLYINGAIMTKEKKEKIDDNSFINVESFDESAKKIETEGGKMLTKRMDIPGMGDMGTFQDTEGNILAIIESKG